MQYAQLQASSLSSMLYAALLLTVAKLVPRTMQPHSPVLPWESRLIYSRYGTRVAILHNTGDWINEPINEPIT